MLDSENDSQTGFSANRTCWYERMPNLFEKEKSAMLKKYPEFKLDTMDDGQICWIGRLLPLDDSGRLWTLMAVYDDNFGDAYEVSGIKPSVKIYSIDPDLGNIVPKLVHIPAVVSNLAQDSQGNYYIRSVETTDTSAATALSWALKTLQLIEVALIQNLDSNTNADEISAANKRRQKPKHVVFSNRAFTALLAETKEKFETETGGVFLGIIKDDTWYVVEAIDPGPGAIFQISYFEYDGDYVKHLANKVNRMYRNKLDIIGLWHKHPGSREVFSHTDQGIIKLFAEQNNGVTLSALVNINSKFRLTMYVASLIESSVVCDEITYEIEDSRIPQEVSNVLCYSEIEESINDMKSGRQGSVSHTAVKTSYLRLIANHLKKLECCEVSADMIADIREDERDSLISFLVDECEFCDEAHITYTCETNEKNQIEFVVSEEGEGCKLLYSYVSLPIRDAILKKKRFLDCLNHKWRGISSEFEKKTGRYPCFVCSNKLYLYNGNLLRNIMEGAGR